MLLVLFALAGCTERSRLNPIDPRNPQTQGKPTGLRVISESDSVRLTWSALPLEDLSGYVIYRKLPQDDDYVRLGENAPRLVTFLDVSNRFGVLHSYRITARVDDLETPPSDAVVITPGPATVWVADIDARAVVKLTHDGRYEILQSRAFIDPFRLKVDATRGTVWVLDEYTGNLGSLDARGRLREMHESFLDPLDLALDEEDGNLWVFDNARQSLSLFAASGTKLARIDSLPKLSALAFNARSAELWALANNAEQLLRIEKNTRKIVQADLQPAWSGPVRDMAIHLATGAAWFAAGDRVARLNAEGQLVFVTADSFRFASRVAVDQNNGACWVIDDSRNFRPDSRVYQLDAQGRVLFYVDGFERPQSLASNPFDGSCYVLDTLQGRLVKINASGEVVNGYTDFLTPYDIDVVMP